MDSLFRTDLLHRHRNSAKGYNDSIAYVSGVDEGDLPLNPEYTFENFVTGPCNRLAHDASIAVTERPGKVYSPLFIYGGVGLGKSHLLQAVCQRLLRLKPEARILYLSSDSFINQFVLAAETGALNQFHYRYRRLDLLVIDDVHLMAARNRMPEEFLHIFDTLYQQQKQIILSADGPPCEIPDLEERLVSRFSGGLVARIEKPCFETRVAILQKKGGMRGMVLPDDVICHVATKAQDNIRELEGAISSLQGISELQGSGASVTIDLDVAKAALGETGTARQRQITIQQIFNIVTKYYDITLNDLQSKKRHKSITFPRQVCIFLARRHTRYSLNEIGRYFGGRDHATILHAVRAVERQCAQDNEVAGQVSHIEGQVMRRVGRDVKRTAAKSPSPTDGTDAMQPACLGIGYTEVNA
ncbi:MAG TPA: chromosomal replication initiator protein DnaA [Tepidisphaeraceae bacterium]|nr:chromosomal replication initiator protein DnaA [Tepidisphaeraceae bacterium]